MARAVVDLGVIANALVGGHSRFVFFEGGWEFMTTKGVMARAQRFARRIAEKCGLPPKFLLDTLDLLPIKVAGARVYGKKLKDAEKLLGKRGTERAHLLALALMGGCLLSESRWPAGLPVACMTSRGLVEKYPIIIHTEA